MGSLDPSDSSSKAPAELGIQQAAGGTNAPPPAPPGYKRLTRDAIIYVLGDLGQRGLAFLLIPIYTAYLSPADYGIVGLAISFEAVLSILYLTSLTGAFSRYYYDFRDHPDAARTFFGTIWLFQLGYTLLFSLGLAWVGTTTNSLGLPDVPYTPYLQLVVWKSFIASTAFVLPRSLFRVQEKPIRFLILTAGNALLSSGLIIYFVVVQQAGAVGVLQGWLAGTLLMSSYGFWTIFRYARLRWSSAYARAGLLFALPIMPHLMAAWALNLSDRFVLSLYVSLEDLAVYHLGYQIASVLQLLAVAVSNALQPFYFKQASTSDDAPRILSQVATYYLLALTWVSIALVGFIEGILRLIVSNPIYMAAAIVVPWVVAGGIMRVIHVYLVLGVSYTKQVKYLPLVTLLAAAINIGLNFVLVPRYGYIAAAITTFIAFGFYVLVVYVLAQRFYPLPYEWRRISAILAVGIVLAALLYVLSFSNLWVDFAIKLVLWLLFPVYLLLLGAWTSTEQQQIWRICQRFRRRIGGLER